MQHGPSVSILVHLEEPCPCYNGSVDRPWNQTACVPISALSILAVRFGVSS